MKVVAAYQQKTEPGDDTAMESSIAEDKRHGSSTTRSLEDNQVFANDLIKGSEFPGPFEGRFGALDNEDGRQGADAGEGSKFVPPAYERIQNRPQSRAKSDTRCNRPEHSAHGASLNLVGVAVPDGGQRDGDDSTTPHPR